MGGREHRANICDVKYSASNLSVYFAGQLPTHIMMTPVETFYRERKVWYFKRIFKDKFNGFWNS